MQTTTLTAFQGTSPSTVSNPSAPGKNCSHCVNTMLNVFSKTLAHRKRKQYKQYQFCVFLSLCTVNLAWTQKYTRGCLFLVGALSTSQEYSNTNTLHANERMNKINPYSCFSRVNAMCTHNPFICSSLLWDKVTQSWK